MKKAPWPDFAGNDLYEGYTIIHPSGQRGVVCHRAERESETDQWVVNYGDQFESRLCLQAGERGQAERIR